LNDTLDQMDLTDTHRTLHPNTENTFFSGAHGTFSRTDHMLGHKTSLNTFRRLKPYQSIFSNHNGIKLEINYKKKTGKFTTT